MLFHRIHTDGLVFPVPLETLYSGPTRTPCWIIGGGPSLRNLPLSEITASPVPKFAVNLAGGPQIQPDFWTAYDPST